MKVTFWALAIALVLPMTLAADYSHCNALLEHGINNITRIKSANHANAYLYSRYCKTKASEKTDSQVSEAKASIFGFAGGGASSNTSTDRKELDSWCKEHDSFRYGRIL